jgi:hypothetical protein
MAKLIAKAVLQVVAEVELRSGRLGTLAELFD